ncbi:hypothetical protein CFP75_22720 [Amycolatopsis alba DSM 44262]|uniref:Uncharacterized protein n=1 Tax=Amycolatopsis alba DSM 44262 TaxID=1125972 RepID=A0A229RN20_AMYAL|nr:hypothetical protein CFP75_22720 [Amycolatopsis alba DSM 44262]
MAAWAWAAWASGLRLVRCGEGSLRPALPPAHACARPPARSGRCESHFRNVQGCESGFRNTGWWGSVPGIPQREPREWRLASRSPAATRVTRASVARPPSTWRLADGGPSRTG